MKAAAAIVAIGLLTLLATGPTLWSCSAISFLVELALVALIVRHARAGSAAS